MNTLQGMSGALFHVYLQLAIPKQVGMNTASGLRYAPHMFHTQRMPSLHACTLAESLAKATVTQHLSRLTASVHEILEVCLTRMRCCTATQCWESELPACNSVGDSMLHKQQRAA